MSINTVINCDECGVQRQPSNHWWLVWPTFQEGAFMVEAWSDMAQQPSVKHCCGRACVGKALEKWFSAQGEK